MKLFRTDYPLTPSFDLINTSVKLLRDNLWPVFYLMFLPLLVTMVGLVMYEHGAYSGGMHSTDFRLWDSHSAAGSIVLAAGMLLTLLTTPGSMIMQLEAVRGGTPSTRDCFNRGLRYIVPFIGMSILMEFAIIGGFILFIVPGLFLLRSYYLSKFYLVDQQLGPVASLKKSRAESKPNAGYIWGVIGVTILFGILGGILQAIPVAGYLLSIIVGLFYGFAPAFRYNEIKNLKLPYDSPSK